MLNINEINAKELSYMSKWASCCEDIVQAGGGNTSVKQDNGVMLIKASGYSLSAVTVSEGYSAVNLRMISECVYSDYCNDIPKEALISGKRPSIETFLHSMTKKYTIHTHPLCVTRLAVRKDGMDTLKKLFPQSVTVGYAVPGIALARKIAEAMKRSGNADVVFLQNHGLIVSADTPKEAVKLHTEVITRICGFLEMPSEKFLLACRLFETMHSADNEMIVCPVDNEYVSRALKITDGREWEYRYSPDCVVYCGERFAVLNSDDKIQEQLASFISDHGMPKVIICGGLAFVTAKNVKSFKDTESVLGFTAKIVMSEQENDVNVLGQSDCAMLLNWEPEKYRRRVNS